MAHAVRLVPKVVPTVPLAERGRMLFVQDVRELFGKDEKGGYRKSAWWVQNKFAPESKRKLGRDSYWWEIHVIEWLDAQREDAA